MTIPPQPYVQPEALEADPAVAEELYQKWLTEQKQKKKPSNSTYCSCVLVAKALTGYDKVVGRAKNWPINSTVPKVGSVVVTNESKPGHVAVITKVEGDVITLAEGNYIPCKYTTGRQLNINDPVIIGYYES